MQNWALLAYCIHFFTYNHLNSLLKVLGQLSNIVSNLEIHVVVYICLLRVADWEIFNGKSQRKFHAAYFTVQTLYCLQNLYCIYLVMKIALAIILLSSFPTSKKMGFSLTYGIHFLKYSHGRAFCYYGCTIPCYYITLSHLK